MEAFLGMVWNVTLLLALGVVHSTLFLEMRWHLHIKNLLTGLLVGVTGLALMVSPWQLSEGLVFDSRSVLLCITGLFFGFVPTVIAVLMAGAFRIYMGGIGLWTGLGVIVTSASLGLLWRHMRHRWRKDYSWTELYLFGVVVHVSMILWMLVIPWPYGLSVFRDISVPVLVVYPLATVLLGMLLAQQKARVMAQDVVMQQLKEQQALYRVSAKMRMVKTIDETLHILLDESLAVFGADSGSVLLYDPTVEQLQPAVVRGELNVVENTYLPVEGVLENVIKAGETRIVTAADFSKQEPLPPGWQGLCLPIFATTEVVGVFLMAMPDKMTDDSVRLMKSFIEITGSTLHRARLFEEVGSRLQQLQASHAIDEAISANLDLEKTLTLVLEKAVSPSTVDAASIFLLDTKLGQLECAASMGFKDVMREPVCLGESAVGWAALNKQRVVLHSPSDVIDVKLALLMKEESIIGLICVPLVTKGEVTGVLEVYRRSSLRINDDGLSYLETLAGQAAIAVSHARLYNDLQQAHMETIHAYDATIEGWTMAMDLRDKETEGHCRRVAEVTVALARKMGFKEEQLIHIRRGALLHDIGKMVIPDSILLKDGYLSDEEWVIMKQHPQVASDMLSGIEYLVPAMCIPYCHHERWDGQGYPRGLREENIPIEARIFTVVDVFDALTNDRPYSPAWTEDDALLYLRNNCGTHFDPQVVSLFLKNYKEIYADHK
jgi:putative nucleotidyltransferase with HDIG domain